MINKAIKKTMIKITLISQNLFLVKFVRGSSCLKELKNISLSVLRDKKKKRKENKS